LSVKQPLKIAIISDLHIGPYVQGSFVSKIVRTINDITPDIVLIAGDFVQLDEVDADTLTALQPLRDLHATLGTFAVFGNHDHGVYRSFFGLHHAKEDPSELIGDFIERLGITMLTNTSITIPLSDSGSLTIAGIDDAWSGNADLLAALKGKKTGTPVILLSHNPDVISDPLSEEANLIVSGHTHGGQIRLPWIGPVPPLPTRIGRSFDEGIFPLGFGRSLAITRGIGELGPRARLFAPPEVMVLRTSSE
jgi:predicted MPP superfamily phosphohydrolase